MDRVNGMEIIYPLAMDNWDLAEKKAMEDVINSGRFTMGTRVREFEQAISEYFGNKHTIMVNSGSSANLVMLTALKIIFGKNWTSEAEIIVPAISWSTTYTPLYYLGLKPVYVDVNPDDFSINPDLILNAITKNTVAVFAVNILGQAADLDRLKQICEQKNLLLLEDNCESLGAKLSNKFTGRFGIASSHSSFYSHHISTMEGGWISTDDDVFADTCRSLRAHGWIRDNSDDFKAKYNTGDRFRDLFHFVLPGLNFRPLEIEAALGIVQMKKLDEMLSIRRKNAVIFQRLFSNNENFRVQTGQGESSWFAFAIIFEGDLIGKRSAIAKSLLASGIESRPLIAGNFTKQPVNEYLQSRVFGNLPVADEIHSDGIYIGNHPKLLEQELNLAFNVIKGFI